MFVTDALSLFLIHLKLKYRNFERVEKVRLIMF